jgi:hypothetical protein
MANNEEVKTWSDNIANFAVDALVDFGLIKKEEFEKASAIVAEEILVRLLLNDYPPQS